MVNSLDRFIKAQEESYTEVIEQLKNEKKEGHWMWYYFPQITGLGMSSTAKYYELKSIKEAIEYYNNDILGQRLLCMCEILLNIEGKEILEIFKYPDDLKLKSSMTLFYLVSKNEIFINILKKYFNNEMDLYTIQFYEKYNNEKLESI